MTRLPSFFTLAAALVAFSLLPASRAATPAKAGDSADHDWPQWRGPNRDGVSLDKGLLKKWPAGAPPLLYVFKGMGDGYCPPTIVGNHAYISGKFGMDAYLMAYELPPTPKEPTTVDPADLDSAGKQLWKVKYGVSCGSGENAAPVVDGDLVFVTSGDGDIAGFSTDGKLLWQHNMKKDFKARIQTNASYGFSESPLVDGDKVIVCPGTKEAAMVAYDKTTGKLLWQCENPAPKGRFDASHASTMLSNACGVKHYVNLTGWGLIGVSPEGKWLWGYERTCESSIPTPIIRDDYVFAISSYGFGSVLIKLTPGAEKGSLDSKVVYSLNSEQSENLCGQAVLIGDHIYVGHGKYAGIPQCIDFLTGKQTWRAKQEGSGVAALVAADGMLFFRNESKEIVVIEANPDKYNLITKWIPASHRNGYAPPVVAHGLLYLRDKDLVMAYDIRQH